MKKYHGIDWLRAVACICIMAMHMAVNNQYEIGGFLYERVIPSFTDFVYIFMAVSAYGMCCGYFEKVMSGKLNWTDFYRKRYGKILPFFALLIAIDLVMNFSEGSVYEALTELTLLHGFVPNELTVIGVGWFLGTVFVFYLIFPFFCVLLEDKRRAWVAFVCAVVINYICIYYFDLSRRNFLCSFCFFLLGGLIYLYRDKLTKVKWYICLVLAILAVFGYYYIGRYTFTRLLVVAALLILAISIDCGRFGAVGFISDISMEFYLSHMVIFRGIEKLHLNTRWGNGWVQYLITNALVLVGTVIFSFCVRYAIDKGASVLKRVRK